MTLQVWTRNSWRSFFDLGHFGMHSEDPPPRRTLFGESWLLFLFLMIKVIGKGWFFKRDFTNDFTTHRNRGPTKKAPLWLIWMYFWWMGFVDGYPDSVNRSALKMERFSMSTGWPDSFFWHGMDRNVCWRLKKVKKCLRWLQSPWSANGMLVFYQQFAATALAIMEQYFFSDLGHLKCEKTCGEGATLKIPFTMWRVVFRARNCVEHAGKYVSSPHPCIYQYDGKYMIFHVPWLVSIPICHGTHLLRHLDIFGVRGANDSRMLRSMECSCLRSIRWHSSCGSPTEWCLVIQAVTFLGWRFCDPFKGLSDLHYGMKRSRIESLAEQFWKKFSVWKTWMELGGPKSREWGNETIHSYDGDETSLIPYFSGQPVTKGNQWLSQALVKRPG